MIAEKINKPCAVLVLAGGEGTRMGGGKPQRQLAGRALLRHALDRARGYGAPIAIGARSANQVTESAECVLDDAEIAGPLASLSAGFAWASRICADYLLTLPCDAPFLPDDLSARLAARIGPNDSVALPMSSSQLHPACGFWRVSARQFLAPYVATGRRSLLGFAEHAGYAVEDWGAPERDPFFNLNTPDDLRTAQRWLDQPHLE